MQQRKSRIFDHVVLHVKDINESKKFYRAIMETLGHSISAEGLGQFFIEELTIRENPEPSRSIHIAFQAQNPGSVKLFHETALRSGGKCITVPAERSREGIYNANVMDPDGNLIEAIYKSHHGRRSSISY